MGLDSVVPQEVARDPERAGHVALSALIPALLWLPVLVLLILGTGLALGYSPQVRALLLPAALVTGVRGLVNLFRSVLRGLERMGLDAAVQAVENGLVLGGVTLALLVSPTIRGAVASALFWLLNRGRALLRRRREARTGGGVGDAAILADRTWRLAPCVVTGGRIGRFLTTLCEALFYLNWRVGVDILTYRAPLKVPGPQVEGT